MSDANQTQSASLEGQISNGVNGGMNMLSFVV
jgi:hypothetical protein